MDWLAAGCVALGSGTQGMRMKPRRLLSIAHSYSVRLNRRLVREISRAAGDRWEVTAVAPSFFRGDFGARAMEPQRADETYRLLSVSAHWSRRIHLMWYGARVREIVEEGWDLVHCWEEPYIVAGAQIAWLTPRRTPFVFWTAQNLSKRYPPPFCWFERYCLRRCAAWLACGRSVVETLVARGYGAKPHRLMPLGIDLDHFYPSPAARVRVQSGLGWRDADAPVIGYLGRFVIEKGIKLLMEALSTVTTSWRALFVGSGPLEAELRRWASAYGDRVRIKTGVTHDEVPDYLNAMDVLCAPSQSTPRWREQFGRMLVEAFGCGVPVIASDSAEIPYVVGDAGLVVGERDLQGWRGAIENLSRDPSLRARYGDRGRTRAAAVYSWPVIGRQYLEFFDELVDRSRPGASDR